MNLSDLNRNSHMLRGSLAKRGYMRWWHSFCGVHARSGEIRTFFVEFFIINPGLGAEQPVLGLHPYYRKRGIKPSYVMIKAGVFPGGDGLPGKQLHAFYPVRALRATGSPLIMQAEDCFYSEDRLWGSINVSPTVARRRSFMTDSGQMEWRLEVHKEISCHTGFFGSGILQALNALESYWHGEGIRSCFQGSVTLDGELYHVIPELSYGYADKHWGRNFNTPWFQLSCSRLADARSDRTLRQAALAVNGCCPRFLLFPLRRRLTLQLTYKGQTLDFTRCKWEVKETEKRFIWHIYAKNRTAIVKISASCKKGEMMRLRYENPDGRRFRQPLFAGAQGIGKVQVFRRTPGGREPADTLKLADALCEYRAAE